ncbi:hypothetical protein [Phycisphaera mikurensis]|uniref:Uncharacterized protein n=1 Tax=Phycisphaera mikurensis (strain NBRC 102666 / KCTC 22515 / FYK2301M01) TaxID=1142394 RepID=I0IF91_PHYMF|nr:hypothetical protein [Phycisphaera mikurensis]MBB6440676.1 hypothetical protein [Phycisphaera mikurensis]BAM03929.1 hypothetical protein PSMK_17700 [Phycisphaera mikurensis NBRC 102666]
MSGSNPPAAADLLERLETAGVAARVKLRLDPAAGEALPPALVAEAAAARLSLLRLLVLGEACGPPPPFPSGSLPPLWAVADAMGVRLWNGDAPADGAAERLLVALRAAWPPEVVRPLAARWAARVAEAGDAPGFRRLFGDALDVTRADLKAQRWTPPGAEALEAANTPRPEAAALPGF